jgi:hypothetical protein
MNGNPIICDPTSKEAQELIGTHCEFSNNFVLLQKTCTFPICILEKIDNSDRPFYTNNGNSYCFIRKANPKFSECLTNAMLAIPKTVSLAPSYDPSNYKEYILFDDSSKVVIGRSLIEEVIKILKEEDK